MDKEQPKRSRGRPMTLDHEHVIQVALDKFWTNGYTNTSINEIADSAGITRASLYHSFNNKEALFLAALQNYLDSAPDATLADTPEDASIFDTLMAMFSDASQRRASDTKHRGCMAVNCITELLSAPQLPLRDALLEKITLKKRIITRLITQAVQQKELPPESNIAIKTDLLMNFIFGFNTFSKTGVSEEEMLTLCQEFLITLGFNHPR